VEKAFVFRKLAGLQNLSLAITGAMRTSVDMQGGRCRGWNAALQGVTTTCVKDIHFPVREIWDSRSVTSRKGVKSWYTDGSKSSNTGWSGAGVYRQYINKGAYFSLGGWTTICQEELFAILEVATSKEVTEGREGVIEIYSDSQAVLKALCSARMGNRLIS